MAPYLKDGQYIVARKRTSSISEGTIVLAGCDGREIVKFAGRREKDKRLLLGKDRDHDAGWVDDKSIRAVVVWPRTSREGWAGR